MKLALFSYKHTDKALARLADMVGKPPSQINVCFVITAVRNQYKDELPDWANPENNELTKYFGSVEIFDILDHVEDSFDFASYFKSKDIVYFSGGNVFFLNYYLEKSGVGDVLTKLIKSNKIVYAGGSAGAIIAMNDIGQYKLLDDPAEAPKLVTNGMGLVDFALIVHWEDETYFERLKKVKDLYEGDGLRTITITDNEAIFIDGDNLDKI